MDSVDKKIENAKKEVKDTYLESMYATIETCDLVIQNSQIFSDDKVLKAKKLREETLGYIKKREAIPMEQRL